MDIISKKHKVFDDLRENGHFIRLLLDIGGQCRALEILYDLLNKDDHIDDLYWDSIREEVKRKVRSRYISYDDETPLERAIAHCILSIKTKRIDSAIESKSV